MIGKTIGHYRIISLLGKGGMGEVYLAEDTTLDRKVALKFLPEVFTGDSERMARFEREAKLLASLNHPNIAGIYGLEHTDGTRFLALELIEGQTLADRIKEGPIQAEEALKLALQITEALEAAHEKGVIHRDLKPANIKVTPENKVKLLDFGLAKAFAGEQAEMVLADSPTISVAATQRGVILGTAAYMCPEQAKGKSVDKRADIWAFGAVLFEMLTGKQAFPGDDVSEILASVIKGDSNLALLPENIHTRVREVLNRCLQKDLRKRYSGIADARYEIEQVLEDPSGLFMQPIPAKSSRKKLKVGLPWLAATLVLGAIISGAVIWNLGAPGPRQVIRLSHELPEGQQLRKVGASPLAVSPDGRQFVYSTPEGLYLRSVNELNAKLIAGTEGDSLMPFFSPDGKWIGYYTFDGQLKKVSVNDGAPVVLCEAGSNFMGASWHEDNTIVYSLLRGDIMRVSGDGGTPETIASGYGMVSQPQLLPGGKAVIFTEFTDSYDPPVRIMVYSLESGEGEELFPGAQAMYLPTGHLVYSLDNNIFAVPFDIDKLEATSGPVPFEEGVSDFIVSNSGTLVYVSGTGESEPASLHTLVWVDKEGNEEQIEAEPDMYAFPEISPDGTKVALTTDRSGNDDIWIYDLTDKNFERLTFHDSSDTHPVWTSDGKRIIFRSEREESGIYIKAADGTGEAEQIASETDSALEPYSLSGDGNTLLVQDEHAMMEGDIGTLSMEDDHTYKLLLQEDYYEGGPQVSPDGKWIAYDSMETGQSEVFVRLFPEVNKGKWQISTGGGNSPLWSPDGLELFYSIGGVGAEAAMRVMRVAVQSEPTFKKGTPEELFRGTYFSSVDSDSPWDVHPDGNRFLMMKKPSATVGQRSKIIMVINWVEELKERVPVD